MTELEFARARDVLLKLIDGQPQLFVACSPSQDRGKAAAEFAWSFIREFHNQYEK